MIIFTHLISPRNCPPFRKGSGSVFIESFWWTCLLILMSFLGWSAVLNWVLLKGVPIILLTLMRALGYNQFCKRHDLLILQNPAKLSGLKKVNPAEEEVEQEQRTGFASDDSDNEHAGRESPFWSWILRLNGQLPTPKMNSTSVEATFQTPLEVCVQ